MSDEEEPSSWHPTRKCDEESKLNPWGWKENDLDEDNNPIDQLANESDEELNPCGKKGSDEESKSSEEKVNASDEETNFWDRKINKSDDEKPNGSDDEPNPREIKVSEFNEEENPGDEMASMSDEEFNLCEGKEKESDDKPNDERVNQLDEVVKESDEEQISSDEVVKESDEEQCSGDELMNEEPKRWDLNGNQSVRNEILVQSTPSPRRNSFNDMAIDDDVIPASDDECDSMGEGEIGVPARDKRKRSKNNTPSTGSRFSYGRRLGEEARESSKHAMFSPQRTLFASDDSGDESIEEGPVRKLETVNLVSSDEDEAITNALSKMEKQKNQPKGYNAGSGGMKNTHAGEPDSLKVLTSTIRTDTSTPLMNRRPFSNIDNLDITAIEKTHGHGNFNETIATCAGSDEDSVDEVCSSVSNLSLLDGAQKEKYKMKKVKKLSDIDENLNNSESDASIRSIVTVVEKPKRNRKVINVVSSDDESEEDVGTIDLEDSVESVNSLFDEVEVDDDDDSEEEYSPEKETVSKTKKVDLRKVSPPGSTRGMSKETIKYEFKNSVQKTIQEMARIIEEMPTPDDDNHVPERLQYLKVELFKHQLYGVKWLYWRENQYPGGGILADEMGLGKTVMIIALVLKSKEEKKRKRDLGEEDEWNSQEKSKQKLVPSQSTLVVCPAGMLAQWETEINTKAHRMSVVIFHGPKRKTSPAVLAQNDFVITTYQTLGSEIPKDVTSRSPLSRIHWERIVLDEGHVIRNNTTLAAHGVGTLHANHRWVVTGTPVHNSAKDMFSLISFLRLHPFSDKKVWDFWIGFKGMSKDQSTRLHTIGKSLLLRRTKEEVNGNDSSRQIPPKKVVDVEVELGPDERLIYDNLYEFAAEKFKNFLKNKQLRDYELQNVANNYVAGARRGPSKHDVNFTHMFTLILRLRQASVLPYLIHTMLDEEDDGSDLDTSDVDEHLMTLKNPCFKETFKSAKIQHLLSDLNKLKTEAEEEDRNMDKVIVVSQWVKLLDVITCHLTKAGYSVVTITGKQTLEERSRAMDQLNNKRRRPEVMCLSLGAGGVGLNLVGANHVFFMDLHWNPQLELQAQDRVHRYGQTKNVTITRYVSKDTIDVHVSKLQSQKLELADGILTNTKKQRGGGLSIAQMRTLFDI